MARDAWPGRRSTPYSVVRPQLLSATTSRDMVEGVVHGLDDAQGGSMRIEGLADSRLGQTVLRVLAAVMESRLRYRFFGPEKTLGGAGIRPGQRVLEVGCGTGFFTIPAARLLGDGGSLVAMDRLPPSVAAVTEKVQAAGLTNVRVVEGNALDTRLDAESADVILIFGVIPAPMLPMPTLLAEMHRVLKPGGTMAVWPPSWVHRTIRRSPLFAFAGRRHGVTNYRRVG
jgi:SAM-dependent methyltransferase